MIHWFRNTEALESCLFYCAARRDLLVERLCWSIERLHRLQIIMKGDVMGRGKREIVSYTSEGSNAIIRVWLGSEVQRIIVEYHEGAWCSYFNINDTLTQLAKATTPRRLATALGKTFKCWDVDDEGQTDATQRTREINDQIESLVSVVRNAKDASLVTHIEASTCQDGSFYVLEYDFDAGRGAYYQFPEECYGDEAIHLVDKNHAYDRAFNGEYEIREAFPEFFEIRDDFFSAPGDGIEIVFGASEWPGQ